MSVCLNNVYWRYPKETPPTVQDWVVSTFSRSSESMQPWTLEDINLQLKPGELVAITGHNGAGKTTLIRLVAGILRPTRGTVQVKGRVSTVTGGALGLHPDLSGIENLKIAASLAGVRRKELKGHLDEILEFTELGSFLEKPIRCYSDGMVARLLLSVILNTRFDVYLLDEVFAVDRDFQQKCLRKLRQCIQQGACCLAIDHGVLGHDELAASSMLMHGGRLVRPEDAPLATKPHATRGLREVSP